ncbi:hypothetical protein OKZ62_001781 [Vibrio navarrensis]|nr:hypothetical protein [Vibrio navarrensis]
MDIAKLRRFIDEQNKAKCKARKRYMCILIVLLLVELALIAGVQFIAVSTASIASAILMVLAIFTLLGLHSVLTDPSLKVDSSFSVRQTEKGLEVETDNFVFDIHKEN